MMPDNSSVSVCVVSRSLRQFAGVQFVKGKIREQGRAERKNAAVLAAALALREKTFCYLGVWLVFTASPAWLFVWAGRVPVVALFRLQSGGSFSRKGRISSAPLWKLAPALFTHV
jgi:hypothetical protein